MNWTLSTSTKSNPLDYWNVTTSTNWDPIGITSACEDILNSLSTAEKKSYSKKSCSKKMPGRKIPGIKQIYFNEKTGHTAVVWDDDTSTVVRCTDGEHFEKYLGFCAAIMKKMFGSTSAAKKVMEEKDAEFQKAKKEEARQAAAEAKRKEEAENRKRKLRRKKAKIEDFLKVLDSFATVEEKNGQFYINLEDDKDEQ